MRGFLVVVIVISLGWCGVVQAEASSMAVTVPVVTKHFPQPSSDLNERNRGFGLEYALRKDVNLTTGVFNNSLRKDTTYVGVQYTPYRVFGLHTGVVVALDLSGGYNSVNPIKPIIGALHFATGKEYPIGFNVDILPGGWNRNGLYGVAAAVSMKYSF